MKSILAEKDLGDTVFIEAIGEEVTLIKRDGNATIVEASQDHHHACPFYKLYPRRSIEDEWDAAEVLVMPLYRFEAGEMGLL